MKTETALKKILSADISDALKISKLETLILKTFAQSPNQLSVIAARDNLKSKIATK